MSDTERELRELLRNLAESVPTKADVPPRMLQRARRLRARTSVIALALAGLLVYGGLAGADALRGLARSSPTPAATPSTSPSPSSFPQAAKLVRTIPLQPDIWTVRNGDFYAITV